MRPAAFTLASRAAVMCASLALCACARDDVYRGGAFASFTFHPEPMPPPGGKLNPIVIQADSDRRGRDRHADLDRWIANDELALRRIPRTDRSTYGAHLASLLNGLWLAQRDAELARRLAIIGTELPGSSDEAADKRFFRGDPRAAHADWSAVVARLRGVREGAHPDGRSIAAALLEGDAYAACGRYGDARTTWYRAFSTSVLQRPGHYRFFAAWTSAMRRLLHYRSVPDRTTLGNGCRGIPPPIVDPVG